MTTRNRYLARQLRAALRASRWDASTIALRLHLPRQLLARVLVGDEDVSLRIHQLVANALDAQLELVPCRLPSEQPTGQIETVVEAARRRLATTDVRTTG